MYYGNSSLGVSEVSLVFSTYHGCGDDKKCTQLCARLSPIIRDVVMFLNLLDGCPTMSPMLRCDFPNKKTFLVLFISLLWTGPTIT